MGKVAGLARALAIILAIVAAFVPLGGLNVALVLVVLGLIAGLAYGDDALTGLIVAVLGLPLAGAALANIPAVGAQLDAAANNLALAAASSVATIIAIAGFNMVKADLMGLAAK
jgi:hypothetical protein